MQAYRHLHLYTGQKIHEDFELLENNCIEFELGIVAPIHFKDTSEQDAEKGIYSSLTVEELALFVKAQKEAGLLKNKNMKQVAQNIAKDWHSKQKENISWQYLYNSMSTLDVSTIKSVDSKLMDMLNWLRKMKQGLKIIFGYVVLYPEIFCV